MRSECEGGEPTRNAAFADLRKLAEWFADAPRPRSTLLLERLARRLGVTAVPLLGRELRTSDAVRREAARTALALLATTDARIRVIRELREVAANATADESKVCALGLLSELGEHGAARFADPAAIQRRSALALAAQLDGPSDVASAVDLMLRQLESDDIVQMIEVLAEAAPVAAQLLSCELLLRLDVADALRERLHGLVTIAPAAQGARTRRVLRPTHVAVLVDAAARVVVVASRKVTGERRWRRWAVLIGAHGCIDDCLNEDDAPDEELGEDTGGLIAHLCADGYRVASTESDHARTVVASAVRRTSRSGRPLASAYYLGRDLLDLRDAHVLQPPRDSSTLGRAVDLLAAGDATGARALLETSSPDLPRERGEHAGILAACLLAQGDIAGAIAPLERAIAEEPAWPLHHWNLATALHRLGDPRACYHALRRFLATSAAPTGLLGDPDQPGRVACAERMLGEIERTARLTGTSLARPRKKKRAR